MGVLALTQAHRELEAWRAVVRQLKNASASLDLNKERALHAALLLWGENLAHLRMTQERDVWDAAYDDAKHVYNEFIGDLPY